MVDSKAGILALSPNKKQHQIIFDIAKDGNILTKNGKPICFHWVLSHIELLGNEVADQLANKRHTSTTTPCMSCQPKLILKKNLAIVPLYS